MKKIKNKLSFKLFYNDKFVMFFSILVAFISWIFVSSTSQDAAIFTVTDIPINLPELSSPMQYFGADNLTASVKISGNALVVTSVTSDDIYITASDVSQITKPGTYNIDLIPKKSGLKTDYSFESTVSPSSIDVFVDEYYEKEFTISDKIVVTKVDPSLYASVTKLSQTSVKVSGAKSVIETIDSVCAEYTFVSSLSETTVAKVPIVLYDNSGNKIESSYISLDITQVDATVPVLEIRELNVTPKITNIPDYLNFEDDFVKVEPSVTKVAVPKNASITEVYTTEIDFSKVTPENNKFELDMEIPSGCKSIDNITTADVTFNTDKMVTKKIKISDFVLTNVGADQTAEVTTKSIDVTVTGPSGYMNKLTSSGITAIVDISDKSTLTDGMAEIPVKLSVQSRYTNCWIQGSYTVNVSFSERQVSSEPSEEE